MIIAEKDVQHLNAADVDALPLAHANAMVFNLKTNQLAGLKITDVLRSANSDDMVCICDPADQSLGRPHPQAIDVSMFRKLNQDELDKGFHFNNLTFTLEFFGGKLVISYKNQPVYEEPIYLLFECVDDEPDERMETLPFFENRVGSLSVALKTAYGHTARLQYAAAYPAIRITQDITGWLCERLESSSGDACDDLLAILKFLLLTVGSQSVFNGFIKMASRPFEDVDSVVDALFPEYIRYCGVSAGYRTSLWDGMAAAYQYFDRNIDHEEIVARIEKRFERNEFRAFQDYDIVATSPVETLVMLAEMFRNEAVDCREKLAVATLCFALTGGEA